MSLPAALSNETNLSDLPIASVLNRAVYFHQNGLLDRAGYYYKEILSRIPDHADALHLLGVITYQKKDAEQAIHLIERAIGSDSSHPAFHSNLAHSYLDAGRIDDALSSYLRALQKDPGLVEAYCGLGRLWMVKKEYARALNVYRKAVALKSDLAEAHYGMGNAMKAMGESNFNSSISCYVQAIHCREDFWEAHLVLGHTYFEMKQWQPAINAYGAAVQIEPTSVAAWYNMAIAYYKENNLNQSERCVKRVIALQPNHEDAYSRLGCLYEKTGKPKRALAVYEKMLGQKVNPQRFFKKKADLLSRLGRLPEAIDTYRQALACQPDDPDTLHHLGLTVMKGGDPDKALAFFYQALDLDETMTRVQNSIGNAYRASGKTDQAIEAYKSAVSEFPEFIEAWQNLGETYAESGHPEEAARCIDQVMRYTSDFGLELKRAMLLPLIYDSAEEIDRSRFDFDRRLDALMENCCGTLDDPHRTVRITNHNLALQGKNDREVREKIARIYLKACPGLDWVSPDLKVNRKSGEKIKIGFLSSFLYDHTIGHLNAGIIKQLPRDQFSVFVFRVGEEQDYLSEAIDACADEVVTLQNNLHEARKIVASYGLDILFFPEIGMDSFTYFLAFSRLAPIQIKRGFPVTSGIPNVDYFLSSKFFEPPDAQNHYSEQLVLLNRSGYWYTRPQIDKKLADRNKMGIAKGNTIYACLQSIFKFHPDFDILLGKILREDPNGRLLLLSGLHRKWGDKWLERFNRNHKDVSDRITFLPQMRRDLFISTFMMADAVIDTTHFSGGNTSLECFANHIPVITWPGEFMRGRLTHGYYKMMGIDDCIAHDEESYVELAIRLANDKKWKMRISDKIAERSSVLFEDDNSILDLAQQLEKLVDRRFKKIIRRKEDHGF